LQAIFEGDECVEIATEGLEDVQAFLSDGKTVEEISQLADIRLKLNFKATARGHLSKCSSVSMRLPASYPDAPPEVTADPEIGEELQVEMAEILSDAAGQECLYQLVQLVKDHTGEHLNANADPDGEMSGDGEIGVAQESDEGGVADCGRVSGEACDDASASKCAIEIIHGEASVEKKSTFQSHLAFIDEVDQVSKVMDQLLAVSKLRHATHNIMAYRILSKGGSGYIQDYDDDGETAAGGRLMHLLQIVDAQNVIVVVSRWYGGVKLGPARFSHINNSARKLLEKCGCITQTKDATRKKVSKKQY